MKYRHLLAITAVVLVGGIEGWNSNPAQGAVIAQDNFDRADSNTIGTMSDGVHSWYENDAGIADSATRILGNVLYMFYSSGTVNGPGVAVKDVTVADGVISITIPSAPTASDNSSIFGGVTYRAATELDASLVNSANAYHVVILAGWDRGTANSKDLYLRYGSTNLVSVDLGTAYTAMNLEISFEGNHHIVKVNGDTKIDYVDPTAGRDGAGSVGLGGWFIRNQRFDDFTLSSVPEPSTLSASMLLLSGWLLRRR